MVDACSIYSAQATVSHHAILAWAARRPSARRKPRPWPNKFTYRRIIRYRLVGRIEYLRHSYRSARSRLRG